MGRDIQVLLALLAVVARGKFGRRQGIAERVVDVGESLPLCLAMYREHPSAVIGRTWGDMPPREQEQWKRARCDDFAKELEAARNAPAKVRWRRCPGARRRSRPRGAGS